MKRIPARSLVSLLVLGFVLTACGGTPTPAANPTRAPAPQPTSPPQPTSATQATHAPQPTAPAEYATHEPAQAAESAAGPTVEPTKIVKVDPNAVKVDPNKVQIRWYCCLGTCEDPEQVDVEQKVVEQFNASHPKIQLILEVVAYNAARDTLSP